MHPVARATISATILASVATLAIGVVVGLALLAAWALGYGINLGGVAVLIAGVWTMSIVVAMPRTLRAARSAERQRARGDADASA